MLFFRKIESAQPDEQNRKKEQTHNAPRVVREVYKKTHTHVFQKSMKFRRVFG